MHSPAIYVQVITKESHPWRKPYQHARESVKPIGSHPRRQYGFQEFAVATWRRNTVRVASVENHERFCDA